MNSVVVAVIAVWCSVAVVAVVVGLLCRARGYNGRPGRLSGGHGGMFGGHGGMAGGLSTLVVEEEILEVG